MTGTFHRNGNNSANAGYGSQLRYVAVCGLLLLCFAWSPAQAQYKSKTVATSNAQGFTMNGFGIAVNGSGTVYATGTVPYNSMTQTGGIVVQEVVPASATVAGGSYKLPCGAPATSAGFTDLAGLSVDGSGNLYIAQSGNGPVMLVSGGGITCLTGNDYSTNEYIAFGVAPDNSGGAYFSAESSGGNVVNHATAAGAVAVIAGDSVKNLGGCGDNSMSPTGTVLGSPVGLATDAAGNLYIADQVCHVVWKLIPSTGALTVVAGTPGDRGYAGDGESATYSLLNQPAGVAVDPDGNVYIADSGNNVIRMVRKSDNEIMTIAGNGMPGNYDDPNYATNSEFNDPFSIAVGPQGNVYVGEHGNEDVRELTLTTVATMISPAAGAVLTSPSTKFTWTSVPNVDQYRLTMGSTPGAMDYFDDAGSNLTTTTDTVTDVPCDGRPLYVQLFTKLDGYWLPVQSYAYSAPAGCAAILSPANGSTLGITQTFNWGAASGASGYQLGVTSISPAGNTVEPPPYSTSSTSYTVNNLPCDGKPIRVQLTTLFGGVPKMPGNYNYTACKMLYLYASSTSVSAQGGVIDLYLYVQGPPPSGVSGQLTVTESIIEPMPICEPNPFTHTISCPAPVTISSTTSSISNGSWNTYEIPVTISAAPANYPYATEYGLVATFTVNGVVLDTATVTVTRY